MAASTDEAMDSLLEAFDQIFQEFRNGVSENQSLRLNITSEVQKREALELSIRGLQSENERLTRLYTESFQKLASKIELRTSWQSLKEELKRVQDEYSQKENENRDCMELLKQEHARRIEELQCQIRRYEIQSAENDAAMNQMGQELADHSNHVEFLKRRLEEVPSELESRYHYEIQGLRDCLMVEQEERNELNKRLENLEKELLIRRSNLAEHQRDSTSNQHVETLKQKVMKLRKENETLKRQLHSR